MLVPSNPAPYRLIWLTIVGSPIFRSSASRSGLVQDDREGIVPLEGQVYPTRASRLALAPLGDDAEVLVIALHADVPALGEQALDPVQEPTVLAAGMRVGPTCGARSM